MGNGRQWSLAVWREKFLSPLRRPPSATCREKRRLLCRFGLRSGNRARGNEGVGAGRACSSLRCPSVHSIMISCRALHIALHTSLCTSINEGEREGGREGTDKGFRELPTAMDACHFYGDANAASGHDFSVRIRVLFLYHSK